MRAPPRIATLRVELMPWLLAETCATAAGTRAVGSMRKSKRCQAGRQQKKGGRMAPEPLRVSRYVGGVTVTANLIVLEALPSDTTRVTVAVPVRPLAGVTVTVRSSPPLFTTTILASGNSVELLVERVTTSVPSSL